VLLAFYQQQTGHYVFSRFSELDIVIREDAFMAVNIGGPYNILPVVWGIGPRFSLLRIDVSKDFSCELSTYQL
jgi:hypothetical protein